jgi:hypothetical protein
MRVAVFSEGIPPSLDVASAHLLCMQVSQPIGVGADAPRPHFASPQEALCSEAGERVAFRSQVSISPQDVADFLVGELTTAHSLRQIVGIWSK